MKNKRSEIRKIRDHLHLSQSQFASKFNIPLYTVQDWEHKRRTPPKYIPELIKKVIDNEEMNI